MAMVVAVAAAVSVGLAAAVVSISSFIYVHFVTSVVMLMPMTTGLAAGSNTYDLLIASASACVSEIVEHSSSK